ncbi:MAG: phosphoglucosamine mutase, partial [Oscillospiraceae bacterium]|nr:phosphoglucosamine mutase [Oscillospiraceae bacterium]
SDAPNGVNINVKCGSTYLEALSEAVRAGGYDLGVAFDGDADRCLAVDENGEPVDGDQMMAICAAVMRREGKLKNDGFVATVMSNIGLHKYCAQENVRILCAPVGDRFVLEMMQKEGMMLGGEQSGHVIFLEHMTTGDGELTALQLMAILKASGKKLSELANAVTRYPQVLINVPGPVANADKKALIASPAVQQALREGEAQLEGDGRILLRPSGTEALIRVMVEAGSEERAQSVAQSIAKIVESAQN